MNARMRSDVCLNCHFETVYSKQGLSDSIKHKNKHTLYNSIYLSMHYTLFVCFSQFCSDAKLLHASRQ